MVWGVPDEPFHNFYSLKFYTYIVNIRRATDMKAPKLWKGSSGKEQKKEKRRTPDIFRNSLTSMSEFCFSLSLSFSFGAVVRVVHAMVIFGNTVW